MHAAWIRRGALGVAAFSLIALSGGQSIAATPLTAASSSSSISAVDVDQTKSDIARAFATSLSDRAWRVDVARQTHKREAVSLQTATSQSGARAARRLIAAVAEADQRVAQAKGIGAGVGSLLQMRLAGPAGKNILDGTTIPLVAAAVSDDDTPVKVAAFDRQGRVHYLDAGQSPRQPVYVIDVDTSRAVAVGMDTVRRELSRKGLTSKMPAAADARQPGWWATKIKAIQVSDTQEPWFKGSADIFALVTGFGHDGKPRVDSVDMPYLNYSATMYRPNQVLVNWSSYKYNTADAVLMEDDGNTNYRALAQAIATVLLTITDQGMYIPLANAVMAAMPDSWWTDDPDYVESWYTLTKDSTGRLQGAAGNGWLEVEPHFVQQF